MHPSWAVWRSKLSNSSWGKRERRWRQTGDQEADSVVSPTTQRARFEVLICLIIVHLCVLQSDKADALDLTSQSHQTLNLLRIKILTIWDFIVLLKYIFWEFHICSVVYFDHIGCELEEKSMARSPSALTLYLTWLKELSTAGPWGHILDRGEPGGNYTQWIDTLYVFVFARLNIICFFILFYVHGCLPTCM